MAQKPKEPTPFKTTLSGADLFGKALQSEVKSLGASLLYLDDALMKLEPQINDSVELMEKYNKLKKERDEKTAKYEIAQSKLAFSKGRAIITSVPLQQFRANQLKAIMKQEKIQEKYRMQVLKTQWGNSADLREGLSRAMSPLNRLFGDIFGDLGGFVSGVKDSIAGTYQAFQGAKDFILGIGKGDRKLDAAVESNEKLRDLAEKADISTRVLDEILANMEEARHDADKDKTYTGRRDKHEAAIAKANQDILNAIATQTKEGNTLTPKRLEAIKDTLDRILAVNNRFGTVLKQGDLGEAGLAPGGRATGGSATGDVQFVPDSGTKAPMSRTERKKLLKSLKGTQASNMTLTGGTEDATAGAVRLKDLQGLFTDDQRKKGKGHIENLWVKTKVLNVGGAGATGFGTDGDKKKSSVGSKVAQSLMGKKPVEGEEGHGFVSDLASNLMGTGGALAAGKVIEKFLPKYFPKIAGFFGMGAAGAATEAAVGAATEAAVGAASTAVVGAGTSAVGSAVGGVGIMATLTPLLPYILAGLAAALLIGGAGYLIYKFFKKKTPEEKREQRVNTRLKEIEKSNLTEEQKKIEREKAYTESEAQAATDAAEEQKKHEESWSHRFANMISGGAHGINETKNATTPANISVPSGPLPAGEAGLLEQIARGEGTSNETAKAHGYSSGYDVTLGYGKYGGKREISKMTMAELKQHQNNMLREQAAQGIGEDVRSSAAGKYQITRSTLFGKDGKGGLFKQLGLKDTDVYSPELQDKLGRALLRVRGLDAYKSGKMSEADFQKQLSLEWASIAKDSSGQSAYGQHVGTSQNQIRTAMSGVKGTQTALNKTEVQNDKVANSAPAAIQGAEKTLEQTKNKIQKDIAEMSVPSTEPTSSAKINVEGGKAVASTRNQQQSIDPDKIFSMMNLVYV